MRFEHRREPLLPLSKFVWRLARSLAIGLVLVGLSLVVGIVGYRHLFGLSWIDAFVNASMILSGMGPVGELQTWGGKCFAGWYALYSGLALILVSGLILAPIGIDPVVDSKRANG